MRNIRIKIGGITFSIDTDFEFNLSEIDRRYHPFFTTQKPRVSIELIYKKKLPFPILTNSKLIFDSQAYWQLYHYKDSIVVVWKARREVPLITHIGIFDKDFKIGKIYLRYRYRRILKRPRFINKISISKKPHTFFYQNILGIIMLNLPLKNLILFHAAGIKDNEKGYLFPGYSGEGKSTMSSVWRNKGAAILSDEHIIV